MFWLEIAKAECSYFKQRTPPPHGCPWAAHGKLLGHTRQPYVPAGRSQSPWEANKKKPNFGLTARHGSHWTRLEVIGIFPVPLRLETHCWVRKSFLKKLEIS